ncbi:hypothetical protein V8E53_014049 [Lactarius tabidus]
MCTTTFWLHFRRFPLRRIEPSVVLRHIVTTVPPGGVLVAPMHNFLTKTSPKFYRVVSTKSFAFELPVLATYQSWISIADRRRRARVMYIIRRVLVFS